MDDKCVVCGRYVPEGRQVCYLCEWMSKLPKTSEVSHEMTAREFIEIWNRLCKSYNTSPCEKCPVHEWCMGPPRIAEYKEMKTVLVEWAKEHPEERKQTMSNTWIDKGYHEEWTFECSACGGYSPEEYDFCPHCGADMRGE